MALPFLSATWRNLIVINYEIDPAILKPLLPLGTELDLFENKALVSIIAFNFERMKLFGAIPTVPVTDFEELNLRFYVRRTVGDDVRRGVVFVKEVVPSALIATTARLLYNEPYEARPMRHSFAQFNESSGGTLSYEVSVATTCVSVEATTAGELRTLQDGSIQHFILEHYWGYTGQDDGTTSEYRVRHAPWSYWETSSAAITGEITSLYPASFKEALRRPSHSAFVARGSPVEVYAYRRFSPHYDTSTFPIKDARGYLLYDGACGLCSWWISKLHRPLENIGFRITPLQSAWVGGTLSLSPERIMEDIRLILADGTLLSGANVYIHLMKRMRWSRLLGLLLDLPVLKWVAWKVYRIVNRNRFGISRVCNLQPHHPDSNTHHLQKR